MVRSKVWLHLSVFQRNITIFAFQFHGADLVDNVSINRITVSFVCLPELIAHSVWWLRRFNRYMTVFFPLVTMIAFGLFSAAFIPWHSLDSSSSIKIWFGFRSPFVWQFWSFSWLSLRNRSLGCLNTVCIFRMGTWRSLTFWAHHYRKANPVMSKLPMNLKLSGVIS